MSETISKALTKSTYKYSVTNREDFIPGKYRYFVEGEWVEEEDMTESGRQHKLSRYLESVLQFLFRFEQCYISGDIFVYPVGKYQNRISPDVFLVKGINLTEVEVDALKSYAINPPSRPAPNVVIEISSEATWEVDVFSENKPLGYVELGVQEYFAYDPLGNWANTTNKLRGWRYDNKRGIEIEPDAKTGWLWSNELDSWLVPDGSYLRLYDRKKKQRLSEVEAISAALHESERREQAAAKRAATAKRREEEARQRETEARQREEAANQLALQERVAREALERTIAELKAQLAKKQDI